MFGTGIEPVISRSLAVTEKAPARMPVATPTYPAKVVAENASLPEFQNSTSMAISRRLADSCGMASPKSIFLA